MREPCSPEPYSPEPSATTPWWQRSTAELLTDLRESEQDIRQRQARQTGLIAEIATRGSQGYATMASLVAGTLNLTPQDARARVHRSEACHAHTVAGTTIPATAPATAAAYAAGTISADHVDTLTGILDAIPHHVPAEERATSEAILIELAAQASPNVLRKAGRHLLARLDQDGKPPSDDEPAQPDRALRWNWTRSGTLRFTGHLDREAGQLLETLISPLAKPRPADGGGEPDRRGPSQRQGDALAEILDYTMRSAAMPTEAGEPPHIIVTMTLEQLLRHHTGAATPDTGASADSADADDAETGDEHSADDAADVDDEGSTGTDEADSDDGAGAGGNADRAAIARPSAAGSATPPAATPPATSPSANRAGGVRARDPGGGWALLNWEFPITAEQARRLACDARMIPAVFGGNGELLDLGRATRTATAAQRRALALRDRGCSHPGCDRPARWCHVHHIVEWHAGNGPSDLNNMVLLCSAHHRLMHHSEWQIRIAADGLPESIPPAWLDPTQTPRRNRAHHIEPHQQRQRQRPAAA